MNIQIKTVLEQMASVVQEAIENKAMINNNAYHIKKVENTTKVLSEKLHHHIAKTFEDRLEISPRLQEEFEYVHDQIASIFAAIKQLDTAMLSAGVNPSPGDGNDPVGGLPNVDSNVRGDDDRSKKQATSNRVKVGDNLNHPYIFPILTICHINDNFVIAYHDNNQHNKITIHIKRDEFDRDYRWSDLDEVWE